MGNLFMARTSNNDRAEVNMQELSLRLKSLVDSNSAEIMRLSILSIIEEIEEFYSNK